MGEVYKALDTRLDRIVAVKVLSGPAEELPALTERLRHEAQSLSRLNHPHICTLYDFAEATGRDQAPLSYLVMEYVEGETLAARISRGALPVERALAHGAEIADALDRAHRTGMTHGDLKPANIMVTRTGVKLLDFGLSRRRSARLAPNWADAATQSLALPAPSSVEGTLQYLAPEQLEGGVVDERADVFACGAVLFEMLTGRRAFEGDSPAAVIAAIVGGVPPRVGQLVPGVPPGVERVVALCLAKVPDERWQHAGDLSRELRWLATLLDDAGPRAARPGVRLLWWPVAAGLAVVAALGLAIWALVRERPATMPVLQTSLVLPDGLRFSAVRGAGPLALSPDGRLLALAAIDAAGVSRLFVRQLDSQGAEPLDGTEGAEGPFWSPDSKSLGFVAQGQLKTVVVGGGRQVTTIAPEAMNATATWNRQGQVLFTPRDGAGLMVVDVTGGAPRTATRLDTAKGEQTHRNPRFLPNGRDFLYVASGRNGSVVAQRALYAASLDDSRSPVRLVENVSGAVYSDGFLLFLRDATLYAQAFDPERLQVGGEPRVLAEHVESGGASAGSFAVSDGGLLAFRPWQSGSQLAWFDRQGRQLSVLPDVAAYGDVELSPDGLNAAVSVLDPLTNTRDLWILDLERGVRTRLTSDPGDEVAPVWSADGTRLLFTSNRLGHFDLYEKATSGMDAETLVFADEADKYPTGWDRGSKQVLYWTYSAEGSEMRVLTSGRQAPRPFLPSPVSPGRLAPHGAHVAYFSAESGRSEVYLVPFPAATRRWQVSSGGGSLARWRADGREVFYLGRDNQLMAAPIDRTTDGVDIGRASALFEARQVGVRYHYDVTPDGNRFLVNITRGASAVSSVTLLQNWPRLLETK